MSRIDPSHHHIECLSPAGRHRMAYTQWGDADNPRVLLCLHGLLRTGRDFDEVARQLSSEYRVICPDMVGRGASDWLADFSYYAIPQYMADVLRLLAALQCKEVDWVGTSMGGLIALSIAGLKQNTELLQQSGWAGSTVPMGKLVLNDVGTVLDPVGLARIMQYIAQPSRFQSWEEVLQVVQQRWETFGPHSAAQWGHLARYVFKKQGSEWVNAYDPGIALAVQQQLELDKAQQGQLTQWAQQNLWQAFESLVAPCLIVRGEFSDLLSIDTAHEMLVRQPQAIFYQVPGVGHAPTFMQPDQLRVLSQFLLKE